MNLNILKLTDLVQLHKATFVFNFKSNKPRSTFKNYFEAACNIRGKNTRSSSLITFSYLTTRAGVEDTRLEAKDTKKIRGQDQAQPFRGQTLSRPRKGMLEAKAKDTSASALQKKRSSQKFFRRSPEKNVLQKFFPALDKILTIQKIVPSLSRGQANF